MKFCPDCRHCYEDSFNACVRDQTPLVVVRPGACLVAQKYSLDRLLAVGVVQTVYCGRHLETDRPYAIKLLLPEAGAETVKNFRREALAAAHLNTRVDHQHVAKTYDYGLLPDGTAYVVTELVGGQSLRQYMDEAGQLPAATAARIARQVADGLEAAHRCGVVHHDLEPTYIILARDYDERLEAKIVDFGFAALWKQRGADNGHAAPASERSDGPASPYIAPEQRTGQNPDSRSDIYSLGVILYEMLAGGLPFGAVGHDHEQEPPPLAQIRGDVPEPLARLVTEQLRGRPSSRPHSAAEVAQRLRAVENMLATGYTVASVRETQALPAGEPATPNASPATARTLAAAAGAQPAAAPSADSRARAHDSEPDGANVAAYDDLDALQEELGGSLDEVIVTASAPAKLRGPARQSLGPAPAALSASVSVARPRDGARQPEAAVKPRRARLLYATLAAIILGIACGLWLTSRRAYVSSPAPPQTASAADATGQRESAAFAETSSADGAGETSAGDASGGAEHQSPTASPGTIDERAPAVDEAAGQKGLGAKPPEAAELRRGEATAGTVVSAGREPERRIEGGRCMLSVSESSLSVRAGGGSNTITVSATGNARVTATTNNWPDIAVFSESRGDGGGPVRYTVVSVSKRAGTFAVNFKSPCGVKTVPVTVK